MRFVLFFVSCLAIAGEFTTSLGDAYPYTISAITTDAAGNTYVVGSRQLGGVYFLTGIISSAPVVFLPPDASLLYGGSDVFVSKLDPGGKVLFTDTFAGKGVDRGLAIALDPSGNIYIGGSTTSNDFPLSRALQTQAGARSTGFVMKLSNDGAAILYSTYFGGTQGYSSVTGLATDAKGNLYLTGTTTAADFPHTPGMPFGPNSLAISNTAVFMASISEAGDKILFSGALISGPIPIAGGTAGPSAAGVAVDAAGNAYFAGNVGGGQPFPGTAGVLMPAGSFTGFAAKINAAGLSYLTYLPHSVFGIAADSAGDLYLAGFDYEAHPGAPPSGYAAKLNPTATTLLWTNNFNGLADSANSIAVDAVGNVWVGGGTSSPAFPNFGWSTGSEFVAQLNASGFAVYSALYPSGTVSQSLAVDAVGLLHTAGCNAFVSTLNPGSPPTMRIFDFGNVFGGKATARISPSEVISIYGPGIGPAVAVPAIPTSGFFPKTLGGVQVTINGIAMPLFYVSANQINAVVPKGIAMNSAALVRVMNSGTTSPDYPVWIVPGASQALPTVVNQDGSVNSEANPAKSGSVVTFYATGWQSDFSPLADGQVATAAHNICFSGLILGGGSCAVDNFDAGFSAAVLYGGAAPGIVAGVSQINLRVPGPDLYGSLNVTVYGPNGSVTELVWTKP